MYAQPMAPSASAASTPPCTVPIGFVWLSPAASVTTASPSLNDARLMPRSVATGGGANSPRTTLSIASRGLTAPSLRGGRGSLGRGGRRGSPRARGGGDRRGGDDQQRGHEPEDGLVRAERVAQQRRADRREGPGAVGA